MHYLNQVSDGIKWCFTQVPEDGKPTVKEYHYALGLIVTALALRALGFLNNQQTLFVTGASFTFLFSNVVPIPLFTRGPIIASILAAAYCTLKILKTQIAYPSTPSKVSQPENQTTSLDKHPLIVMARFAIPKKPQVTPPFKLPEEKH